MTAKPPIRGGCEVTTVASTGTDTFRRTRQNGRLGRVLNLRGFSVFRLACHARGCGFESGPSQQIVRRALATGWRDAIQQSAGPPWGQSAERPYMKSRAVEAHWGIHGWGTPGVARDGAGRDLTES